MTENVQGANASLRNAEFAPYLTTLLGPNVELLDLDSRPLTGGLMADVRHLSVRYSDARGTSRLRRLVVKRLDAATVREARIYEVLATTPTRNFMPRLEGFEARSHGEACLYLEAVEASSAWPWTRLEDAARVIDLLASLHARDANVLRELVRDWDYEQELEERALETLATLEQTHARTGDRGVRASLPAARRLVRGLRRWRRELVDRGPLPSCVIHGDVHPGNVLVRAREERPVLLDWARARTGSPLEDVSSWLQWLGFWEPVVKRKHDTLLARYLLARDLPRFASDSVRAAYWMAGASNCLAGALRHHLLVLGDRGRGEDERAAAQRAANDCLRVLRRADAYDRGTQRADRSRSNATSCGP